MAANEHKNLSSINRHNPKDFENAINDTVLTKSIGTSATGTDGGLVWMDKSLLGATNYNVQGYGTGLTNYAHGVANTSTYAPYNMSIDYGNSDVSLGSLSPSVFSAIGQGCSVPEASSVTSISGWVGSSGGYVVTVAICKITPVEGVITNVVPIVIDEIAVTGLSSIEKLIRVKETTITTAELAAGDIIFPMIKEATAGSTLNINLTIQTTTP
tara:strand:- start:329 stop:967 length:639 start_codon:yes stop_codon:yes gene_type:complete